MDSIKELFKIGHGPSSSHTMGPRKAAEIFLNRNSQAGSFRITLYGSLAATGKGHLTDEAILKVLEPVAPTQIIFEPTIELPFHPNGMLFEAFDSTGNKTNEWTTYSVGGGTLSDGAPKEENHQSLYNFTLIEDIKKWCDKNGSTYWEYVEQCEGPEIWDYLKEIWDVMRDSVTRGLEKEGVLPGGLGVRRKASDYLIKAKGYDGSLKNRGMVYAYALAVSEENASGGKIVTAPTCGGSGVLPAVLYYLHKKHDFRETRILKALATAGLFGNVVKYNASISGAEVGCQGEVGVACAMASAAACQLFGGSVAQIEYAAEMGLEHHLGLTCDPVCGMVQIPCIERNAFAAARALDSNIFATFSDGRHRVSFDHVVEVMKQTGHDLPSLYKETSEGGLAKMYKHIGSLGC
ncbi:MAG: L-serine ammonia-lyase [Breznakibacter sp.]|nr:L-serine ammonia-lyase [Breznakibacter sp.]